MNRAQRTRRGDPGGGLFDFFANFELLPGLAGMTNATVNGPATSCTRAAGSTTGSTRSSVSAGAGRVPGSIPRECARARGPATRRRPALQAIEEAVDAEFPTVANHVRRHQAGNARSRPLRPLLPGGRSTRTRPELGLPPLEDRRQRRRRRRLDRARMQEPYTSRESRADIRNAALCYPAEFWDMDHLDAWKFEDDASRDLHGTRTWTAPNLAIEARNQHRVDRRGQLLRRLPVHRQQLQGRDPPAAAGDRGDDRPFGRGRRGGVGST